MHLPVGLHRHHRPCGHRQPRGHTRHQCRSHRMRRRGLVHRGQQVAEHFGTFGQSPQTRGCPLKSIRQVHRAGKAQRPFDFRPPERHRQVVQKAERSRQVTQVLVGGRRIRRRGRPLEQRRHSTPIEPGIGRNFPQDPRGRPGRYGRSRLPCDDQRDPACTPQRGHVSFHALPFCGTVKHGQCHRVWRGGRSACGRCPQSSSRHGIALSNVTMPIS